MTIDQTSQASTLVRRLDRAVGDEEWIKSMLSRMPYGTLAMALDAQPFVKPVLFAFDEAAHAIFIHGAREGRTAQTLPINSNVCFTVAEMGRILPGTSAKGFSLEYASVVVFGRATLLTDQEEARRGLQLILDKFAPHLRSGADYLPMTPDEVSNTNVYRIDIEQWSGKRREADADHPGAYRYGDHLPKGDVS